MIYTTGTSGRVEGLRMMTKVETGSHLGMSLVHSRKVSAMILEPVSTGMVLHHMQCSCGVMWSHILSCHVTSRVFVYSWCAAAPADQDLHQQQLCSVMPADRFCYQCCAVLHECQCVSCASEVFVPVHVWLCASRKGIQACLMTGSHWLSVRCTGVLWILI